MFLRFRGERNSFSAVHFLRDDFDLLLDREFEVVEEFERVRGGTGFDDGFTEIDRSFTSLGPVVARDGGIGSSGESLFLNESDFGRSVRADDENNAVSLESLARSSGILT